MAESNNSFTSEYVIDNYSQKNSEFIKLIPQIPFLLNVDGAISLRLRARPYVTTIGDPNEIFREE